MVRFLDEEIISILIDYAITYDPALQKLTMSTEESNNGYEFTIEDKEKFIQEPYTIIIDLTAECVEPHQSVSDEEPVFDEEPSMAEEPPRVSRSFKTDKCVVCLSKDPRILFLNCLHYCVCSECEEANPFRKCPSCRTRIETKVMI